VPYSASVDAIRQGNNEERRAADAAQNVPEESPDDPLSFDCAVQAPAGYVESQVGVTKAQYDDRLAPLAPHQLLDAFPEPGTNQELVSLEVQALLVSEYFSRCSPPGFGGRQVREFARLGG
jgi:hypothetical protein